jgi:hypothetical protein
MGMLNQEGNLGRVLKGMGSKESLKSLGTDVLAAALVGNGGSSGKSLSLLQQFQLQGLRSFVRAGLDVTIRGQDGKKALRQALKNTVTSALGAHLAGKIGQMYRGENPSLDYAGHKVMHGFLGGALGAISSEGKLEGIIAGAGAAVMAEVMMEAMMPDPQATVIKMRDKAHQEGRIFDPDEFKELLKHQADIAKLAVALSAFALDQDVNVAVNTATNAIENNWVQIALAVGIPTAKILIEIYILTHEEEIEATKQQICSYVAEKLGYSPRFVEFVFDGAMMAGSTFRAVKQGGKMLVKKFVKTGVTEGAKALKAPQEPAPRLESKKRSSDLKEAPQLLLGEGRVGTYEELAKTRIKGSNLARHHIPNDQYMKTRGVSRNEGISITVEQPTPGTGGRHREIHKTLQKQDPTLAPRDALAQGIQKAREVYREEGALHEIRPSLQEVIRQNKERYPTLFKKGD